jgi:hypothetical protein
MNKFDVREGVIHHLNHEDFRDLIAFLMTLRLVPPPSVEALLLVFEACLQDGRKEPWSVIHDEDLITIHRKDDDKPVVLFVRKHEDA